MLRVLLVSVGWPFPEYKNGVAKIVANLLVKNEYFKSDLLFVGEEQIPEDLDFIARRILPARSFNTLVQAYRFAISTDPRCTWNLSEILPQLANELDALHKMYDVIHLIGPEFALLSKFSEASFFKKLVFTPIDSIGLHFERRTKITNWGLKKLLYQIEAAKCKAFEVKHYPYFSRVSFVSDVDASWVGAKMTHNQPSFVPNGVDIEYFYPAEPLSKQERPVLLFTGNMDYAPNADAVLFLIDHIFPLIEQKHDVDLYIVGANPSAEIKKRQRPNIHITGFVPDIREYLQMATVYISPLREGSGIKNKVLEAMAFGRAIVGTPISFEGINVINGRDCIKVSADPKKIADAVQSVLVDLPRILSLGKASRELIEHHYSWLAVSARYLQLYQSILCQ